MLASISIKRFSSRVFLRHKRYNNGGGCRVMMRCCLYNVRRLWPKYDDRDGECPSTQRRGWRSGSSLTRHAASGLDSLHIWHRAHGGPQGRLSSFQVIAWFDTATVGSATLVLIVIFSRAFD